MNRTGGDPSYLRRFNSSAVLRVLHEQGLPDATGGDGGLTVSQIAAAVNVSRPTAEEAADALHDAGWIDVISPAPGDQRAAGRPARKFRFRPSAGFVLGIAVEATSVFVAVSDLAGTVVGSDRRVAPPQLEADARLDTIREAIDSALAAADVSADRVLGGAVGTTGIVDPFGRVLVNNLPGWPGINLADAVTRMIDAPVSAFNHLRLSALGERWRGAAQHADDVVHIHAGQRMGLGVVIGGRPLIGAHGAAGEFTPTVSDGWIGAYRTLLEHPLGVLHVEQSVGLGGDIGDANRIFDAAAEGDVSATNAVDEFVRELIDQVAPIVAAFDPEVVVIGGDLARAGSVTIGPVQRRLEADCPLPAEVRVSQLGDDSITLGAIRAALDDVEERLFDDPHASPWL
ncbi:UNVERIFIED_CONTAM: ROK family protein [Microbacterium sp. SLM126]